MKATTLSLLSCIFGMLSSQRLRLYKFVISFWGLIHLGFQRHPGNKPQYYVASCLIVSHTTTRPFFYIHRCKREWESQLGFSLLYQVISSFIRPSVSVCPSMKPLRPSFHCTFRIQFCDWVTTQLWNREHFNTLQLECMPDMSGQCCQIQLKDF